MQTTERRVVITGLGLVCPLGIGLEPSWSALAAGKGGVGKIRAFPVAGLPNDFGGEVQGFDPKSLATPKHKRALAKSLRIMARDIQLAVAAGYEVFTTASPHNFDYVRGLGASRAFDYNSPSVVPDLIAAFEGKTIAGAFSIGKGSAIPCFDVVHASKGDKAVATASRPGNFAMSTEKGMTPSLMFKFATASMGQAVKARMTGIRTKFVFGDSLADNEVGRTNALCRLPTQRLS